MEISDFAGSIVDAAASAAHRGNPLDKSFSELAKVFPEDVFTNAARVLRPSN